VTEAEEIVALRKRVADLEAALRGVGEYVKWSNPRSLSRRDREAKLLALHVIVANLPEDDQHLKPVHPVPVAHPVHPMMGEVVG